MKVKKVGELPKEQSIEIKSHDEDSQLNISNNSNHANRKYIIGGSVILLALIGLALYFFVIKDNNGEKILSTQNSAEYDEFKLKELELKERELILKEKEMKLKKTPDESSLIKAKIKNWINDINNRNYDFINFYSPYVNYYSWGNTSKERVIGDKRNFFNNWDSFYLTISEPNIEKISDDKYLCAFDKTINSSNQENGKVYEAKVSSKLIFQKLQNNWLITDEVDETVYYKNKNW